MTDVLSPLATTRLEKAAADNGFDLVRPGEGAWLSFASSQCPLRVWMTVIGDAYCLVGLSQINVFAALAGEATEVTNPVPTGAVGVRGVAGFAALHELVRRAFRLAATLPDELLHRFEKKTAGMPMTTEVERLARQRVGQSIYRDGLMDLWQGRCAISGLALPELLVASHAKPWAACDSDAERLDVFNGLLLAAHFDKAFDAGLIAVADDGAVIIADAVDAAARAQLGWGGPLSVKGLKAGHHPYLRWQRDHVFVDRNGESR